MFVTLLRAIDTAPADMTPRLALADWLACDCADSKLALLEDGFRATAACGLVPWYYTGSECWGVFSLGRMPFSRTDDRANFVDADWFDAVIETRHVARSEREMHTPERNPKYGPRTLLKALAAAFPKLPEPRRRELLAGTPRTVGA